MVRPEKRSLRAVAAVCVFLVLSLLGVCLAAWAVHASLSAGEDGTDLSLTRPAEPSKGAEALLTQLAAEIEPTLVESRHILLGQRPDGDPTCTTRNLEDNQVVLQGNPTGGIGLRAVAFYDRSPDTPLALYHWSQETLRPFLRAQREANASVLARVEGVAIAARQLATIFRGGPYRSAGGVIDEPVNSPAWPAECLRRLRRALMAGDSSSVRTWSDELAAATFALADLHRWLNVALDSHLTSLEFQARCRVAFEWTDSASTGAQVENESCLPAAGQMVAWSENYLEVERQAEGLFWPTAAAAAIVDSHDLSSVPAARRMPPELREAFLSLRGRLSPATQALWDQAAAAPFERSYLANMLFRAASAGSLKSMGLVLERFDRSHTAVTVAELMDALFYRAGLNSSGFSASDRYDPRIMEAAGAITARRELAALRAHRVANSLLKGWENYVGGVMTLAHALDIGKFDCVRGTDLIGALYRGAGLGEFFVVRLNCGTVGHSVGAVPVESGGRRHLLILDCLDPRTPSNTWPAAYFHGLAWPVGYPGSRGLLFSAELYARGLDGCLFAEGYVVRGEHAGRWVRAALPYLPGAEHADSARIFDGPYPDNPIAGP